MPRYISTKKFDGFSTVFRQWRAEGTHCRFLHSYIIRFHVVFNHDEKNIFKLYPEFERYLKKWFKNTFDYKTFIAQDDPQLEYFKQAHNNGLIQLTILPTVGAERFSEFVYNEVNNIIIDFDLSQDIIIKSVETFEHDKNSALFLK